MGERHRTIGQLLPPNPQPSSDGRDSPKRARKPQQYDLPAEAEVDPSNCIPELNNIFTVNGRQLLLDLCDKRPRWLTESVAPQSRFEEMVRIQAYYRELRRRGWYDVQTFLVLPHRKGRYAQFAVPTGRIRNHQQAIREILFSPNAPWKTTFNKTTLPPAGLARLQQPIKRINTVVGLYNMMVFQNIPPHIAIYFAAQPCCDWFAFQEMLLDFNHDMHCNDIDIGDLPTRAQYTFLHE